MDPFTSRVQELDFVDERNFGQDPDIFRMLYELDPICRRTFGSGCFQGVYFHRGAVIYVSVGPGIDFTPLQWSAIQSKPSLY
jgi:hypothetical protein